MSHSSFCSFSPSQCEGEYSELWELCHTLQRSFFRVLKISNHYVEIVKAGVVEFYFGKCWSHMAKVVKLQKE